MSQIVVRRAAESEDLTTLDTVKGVLGISDSDSSEDDNLNRLITVASQVIAEFTDRVLAREAVTERLGMLEYDDTRMMLRRSPVQLVEAIRFQDQAISDLDEVVISDPKSGFIFRAAGFSPTVIRRQEIDRISGRLTEPDWQVDYVAGFTLPSFSAVSGNFDPADVDTDTDTIELADHGLLEGDPIRFSTSGTLPAPLRNDRDYRARDVTDDTFRLADGPTTLGTAPLDLTDSGSGNHTVDRQTTLPASLEQSAIETVVSLFRSQDRDQTIEQERLGDWSARYAGVRGAGAGLPPAVAARLEQWREYV